jgi:hypothetical protein
MSKKLMLLAAGALSVLAFAALPSGAVAGTWECETTGGAVCGTFSGTGTTTTTLSEDGSALTVECSSNVSTGEYTTKTAAKNVTITFSGCKSNFFGGSCNSAGQASGVIKTFDLTSDNVMLEATSVLFPKGTAGVLLTPTAGEFATFSCAGGIDTVHVQGNGIIGHVTKECGSETAAKTNIALDFETTAAGTQKWKQVTTAGTVFDLSALNTEPFGNTTRTSGQDGTGNIQFSSATKITCP